MKVALLATGQDTAGMGGRIASAFTRLMPEVKVTSIARNANYMAYPGTTYASARPSLQKVWDTADVVHLRNNFDADRWFGDLNRSRRKPKPMVIHHHGTQFRENTQRLLAGARSRHAVQLVSTVDLLLLADDLTWLPSPYDLGYLQLVRERNFVPHDDVLRIAHAPTSRPVKGTDIVIEAIDVLKARGFPIEFDLIERVSWKECLARKAKADLFIDQLYLGYGCNAIEAWGMGIPVISGVGDPRVRAKMVELWGELPFIETEPTVEGLVHTLSTLVENDEGRDVEAERGMAHVRRWHDEAVVIPLLATIYHQAIANQKGA